MSDDTFRPSDRMVKLGVGRRGGDASYLPVRQRMIWFRKDHPTGEINTELLEHVPGEYAVFKATVNWTDEYVGVVSCSSHGSETAVDFKDYVEKAETKAIGRALAAAGYGTEAAFEEDPARPADAPFERPTETVNATRNQVTQIRDLTRVLGLEIRGYLNGEYGVTDPENLMYAQANTVIEKLRASVKERTAVAVN